MHPNTIMIVISLRSPPWAGNSEGWLKKAWRHIHTSFSLELTNLVQLGIGWFTLFTSWSGGTPVLLAYTWTFPSLAHRCRAVWPFLSRALTLAPCFRINSITCKKRTLFNSWHNGTQNKGLICDTQHNNSTICWVSWRPSHTQSIERDCTVIEA